MNDIFTDKFIYSFSEEYEFHQADSHLEDSISISVEPLPSVENVEEIVGDSGNEDEKLENVNEEFINSELDQIEMAGENNDKEKEEVEEVGEIEKESIDLTETNDNQEARSNVNVILQNTIQAKYGPPRPQTGEKEIEETVTELVNNRNFIQNSINDCQGERLNIEETDEEIQEENHGNIDDEANVERNAATKLEELNLVEHKQKESNMENESLNHEQDEEIKMEEINRVIQQIDDNLPNESDDDGDDEEIEQNENDDRILEDSDTTGNNNICENSQKSVTSYSNSSKQLIPLGINNNEKAEILAISQIESGEEINMINEELQEAVARTDIDRRRAFELIKSGDMEAMAELVLSGQGAALLGLASDNPDIQLFINNVPHYMAKIERVHRAAREGDLRGVQTALDRRKFAVARDNSTPLKPTPLHVAALFGRTSVLRYLAGRFPETMHAQDSAGRTPLHYAATLPDNGHFYSLLVTLGADKAFPDNAGRTAEDYLRNKGELKRETLLSEYQNRDVPIDMSGLNFNRYSDKGAELLREGYPIFNPEEGQYLASSLGEPLIKGLTEVAQIRPNNPVVHLAHYLLSYNTQDEVDKKRSIESANNDNRQQTDNAYVHNLPENELSNEDENNLENEQTLNEEDIIEDDEGSDTIDEPAFKTMNRDDQGQSMLHFAAARAHGRNALFQLLQETDANVGLRDNEYRTARDIAQQLEIEENIKSIDKYVISLAARGEDNKIAGLIEEGYDHILDIEDGQRNIIDIVSERDNKTTLQILKGITSFEEKREKLHRAIRFGSWQKASEALRESDCPRRLATAKNQQGRCSLHIAVLTQNETVVENLAKRYPATLHMGDNLLRTPLHYAMGLEKVEPLSRILIAAGAQRVLKDVKGRQPSYYFMNKTDIKKLQDEEEALRV